MSLKKLFAWEWQKKYIPHEQAGKRNTIVKIMDVSLTEVEKHRDIDKWVKHPTVLITGDAKSLAADTREFESWNVSHDLYAVNRSLVFHQRPVDHWAAVDVEECRWYAEHVTMDQFGEKPPIRHSIGIETKSSEFRGMGLFDVYWQMEYEWENDYQRYVFVGNSGYFAVLTAIKMGYQKIVIGGMPLDVNPHWYEPDTIPGPHWTGMTYMQWMDFAMKHPDHDKVRSMSGYSAFILGQATKEWVNGN